MPKACTVCQHAERSAIDQALADAVALRTIAGRHGVALASLGRHKTHLCNGSGPVPEHPEPPAVPPTLIADLRLQAAALRLQADQLRSAHRSYHDYPTDALLLQMGLLLGNVVDTLWPAEG
jgi:hypothetical protein